MNWIFDNLQLIIIVASTIAWWLTQNKKSEDEDPHERPGRKKIEWDQESSEAAEQVRERMRQLREQRRQREQGEEANDGSGGSTTMSPPPPPRRSQPTAEDLPPVLRELMGIPESKPEPPPPAPAPAPPPLPSATESMQSELRDLEKKRREAERMAEKARSRAGLPRKRGEEYGGKGRRRSPRGTASLDDADLLATLRSARHARKAIILREVLDKPVALR